MKRLLPVDVATTASRERKTVCGLREVLVGTRTKLMNSVKGWLRTMGFGPMLRATPEVFPARLRKHVSDRRGAIPPAVERVLVMVEAVNIQIVSADEELEKLSEQDPVCVRLMTVPGVGPVTAVRYAAALEDACRFVSAPLAQTYLALVPRQQHISDLQRS